MTLEDIMALPVAELADQDCHLFLWVVAGVHREGVGAEVCRAWGFRLLGDIIWRKPNYGLGAFPRPQHEAIIIGRRGGARFTRNDVGSVQSWPQVYATNGGKTHSAKPAAAYDLIESASPGPYVDLFARQQRLGWDSWGWGYEQTGVTVG
jgi:N6-adenosine-specific RNA methylase IME4